MNALLEAALFVSATPLGMEKLMKILAVSSPTEVAQIISELQKDLKNQERGIEIVESPEGFEFRVKAEYRERVARLAPFADLSEGMMRTLAIVAAKQPVKQSIIVKYQGNKSYGYIASLEGKGLVRTEKAGRTKNVMTTIDFEKYFGKTAEEVKKSLEEASKK